MSKCSKKITRSGHIWYFWYFQKSGNTPCLSWKNNPSGSSIAASAELPRRCQSSMQFSQRDLSNPQGRYQSSQARRYVLVIQLYTTRLPQKFHYYGKTEYLRAMNEIPPKSLDIPSRWTYPSVPPLVPSGGDEIGRGHSCEDVNMLLPIPNANLRPWQIKGVLLKVACLPCMVSFHICFVFFEDVPGWIHLFTYWYSYSYLFSSSIIIFFFVVIFISTISGPISLRFPTRAARTAGSHSVWSPNLSSMPRQQWGMLTWKHYM